MNRLVAFLGMLGALICTITMFAIPLGLIGSAAATAARAGTADRGMAAMSGMASGGSDPAVAAHPWWYLRLQHFGPEILVVSLLLIVGSLALRRSWGMLPAVAGGAVLYVGMYLQPSMAAMLWWTIAGFALLVVAMLFPRNRSLCKATPEI